MAEKAPVVEDAPAAPRPVSYTLESAGCQVVPTVNGVGGLRKARKEAPVLLVLDAMLPEIDGFKVCHRLRSNSAASQGRQPILVLSAESEGVDRVMGEKAGAGLYLAKPVTPGKLTAAVRALLAERQ